MAHELHPEAWVVGSESQSSWLGSSPFHYLFLKTWGWARDPVSLELLKYFLGQSQTIPSGTCDLEAGSLEGVDSAMNHSRAWLLGALGCCADSNSLALLLLLGSPHSLLALPSGALT